MEQQDFEITIKPGGTASAQTLRVQHQDETFQFTIGNQTVSILNNGDNSWSLVSGELAQELVNEIGQAIETWYRSQPL
ncbi:MAG TPA: hypothetical protein VHA56_22360 [Mucilaginibacter sp.]|nr:hypothetical protein [Mucilaginibacter sp.]